MKTIIHLWHRVLDLDVRVLCYLYYLVIYYNIIIFIYNLNMMVIYSIILQPSCERQSNYEVVIVGQLPKLPLTTYNLAKSHTRMLAIKHRFVCLHHKCTHDREIRIAANGEPRLNIGVAEKHVGT